MTTLNDMFTEYKNNLFIDGYRWRDYWKDLWSQEITEYLSLDWQLIPLLKEKKKPRFGFHWDREPRLDHDTALKAVLSGENLAVIAGEMVLVEADQEHLNGLEKLIPLTRTSRTPRGWRFFLHGPFDHRRYKVLKATYPFLDTPRTGPMYAILPYSRVRYLEDKPPQVYTWASRASMISFPEFIERALP